MGIGKAFLNLILGRPRAALHVFLASLILLIAAPLIAVASFIPILLRNLIRLALITATSPWIIKKFNDTAADHYEDHKKQVESLKRYDLPNKGLVDAHDISPKTDKVSKVILTFLGNADTYTHSESDFKRFRTIATYLKSNLRIVNYPGYATKAPSNIDDIINAGISQVYALMREKNWLSKKDVEENICLQGHSMGGGVALQVALFFKQRYNLDLKVFVDRSFSSLDSTSSDFMTMFYSPMPKWYQRLIIKLGFTAMGDWNMRSAEAVKALNPAMVRVVNVAETPQTQNLSTYDKIILALGLDSLESPDPIIHNGSTLGEACAAMDQHGINGRFEPIYTDSWNWNPHNTSLSSFNTRDGQSAELVPLKHFQPELCSSPKP